MTITPIFQFLLQYNIQCVSQLMDVKYIFTSLEFTETSLSTDIFGLKTNVILMMKKYFC